MQPLMVCCRPCVFFCCRLFIASPHPHSPVICHLFHFICSFCTRSSSESRRNRILFWPGTPSSARSRSLIIQLPRLFSSRRLESAALSRAGVLKVHFYFASKWLQMQMRVAAPPVGGETDPGPGAAHSEGHGAPSSFEERGRGGAHTHPPSHPRPSLFTWKSSAAPAPTCRDKALRDTAGVFLYRPWKSHLGSVQVSRE